MKKAGTKNAGRQEKTVKESKAKNGKPKAAGRELPSERMGVPPTTPDADVKVAAAEDAVLAVIRERHRQDGKWGEQNHDAGTWALIFLEEIGEWAKAELHARFGGPDADNAHTEAVHMTAVALAVIECMNRKANDSVRGGAAAPYPARGVGTEPPHPMLCFQHGGSEACEAENRKHGFTCPKCSNDPHEPRRDSGVALDGVVGREAGNVR